MLIEPEELDALDPKATKTIDIEEFVDLAEIDPIYYDHSYYLAPTTGGAKAYRLLLEAMREAGKVAIGRVVIRSKQQLCALRPTGDAMALSTMLFGDEVLSPDRLDELDALDEAEASKRELTMAQQLIDSLSADFDPAKFKRRVSRARDRPDRAQGCRRGDRRAAGGRGDGAGAGSDGGAGGEPGRGAQRRQRPARREGESACKAPQAAARRGQERLLGEGGSGSASKSRAKSQELRSRATRSRRALPDPHRVLTAVRTARPLVRFPGSPAVPVPPPPKAPHVPNSSPGATGLYHPANEHDGCGIALVAKLWGEASHAVVEKALDALENLEHRGAEGADPNTGDGAGILMQIPTRSSAARWPASSCPRPGRYGVGVCYLPSDPERRLSVEQLIEETIQAEGQRAIWWRDVPVDDRYVGETARLSAPVIRQVIVEASEEIERSPARVRAQAVHDPPGDRARGRAPTGAAELLEPDDRLQGDADRAPAAALLPRPARPAGRLAPGAGPLALLHQHLPELGAGPPVPHDRPQRRGQHAARQRQLDARPRVTARLRAVRGRPRQGDPGGARGGSDSAIFDNVLELLVLSGRSIPHAMMMMIPEAYRTRDDLDPDVRGFYEFHSCMMEPWDGPAAVAFTDGRLAGAVLDRNGLRPGRWIQDTEGYVVLASETGVLTVAPEHIQRKGRLAPGQDVPVDLEDGRIVEDAEVKRRVARRKPYGEWYERSVVHINDLPEREPRAPRVEPLRSSQLAFGYSQEDLKLVIATMAAKGEEPMASMGNDAALAVLSERQPPLFTYFKQLFAQVTNPPIDPIRENVVMSLQTAVGAEVNLLTEIPEQAHQLVMDQPILRNHELEKLRQVSHEIFDAATLDITWPIEDGADGMEARVEALCDEAEHYVENGANILILSDRNLGPERVAMPSLLAVAAVHHHLVREGTRLRTGLVIESGEPRDIHHMATLIGYGASAINPYVMFESLDELTDRSLLPEDVALEEAEIRIVKAIGKGLLKTISKMGISTIQSYCGAQIFEAVGLEHEVIDRYFTGTASRIGGVGLDVLATEALERHFRAYPRTGRDLLPVGGVLQWRRDGELHIWNPDTIAALQHAVGTNSGGDTSAPLRDPQETYDLFARQANSEATHRAALRGLMKLRLAEEPIPLDEVEPASEIVKRFSTGAMSLGSLSREAHETLAIAMNSIGGKSNTGEGGEDPARYKPDENGDQRRSAIKQVASGRFGVTIDYLVNADQLQIKMAQGAKPGEGGQLPGHKVDGYIAKIRNSTPGWASSARPRTTTSTRSRTSSS